MYMGVSGPSLLIESTDSMIHYSHCLLCHGHIGHYSTFSPSNGLLEVTYSDSKFKLYQERAQVRGQLPIV